MNPVKTLLKLLLAPLTLLGIYLLVVLVWGLAGLPSDDRLLLIIQGYFAKYGLWIVFAGALIEGFLLLGQYFPGGFVIFIGVISAGRDAARVIETIFVVSLAFFISYFLNYWVGKHGWYRLIVKMGLKKTLEDSKSKLIKQGMNAIIFSYWEPNLASITATAAGVLHVPLRKFLIFSAIGIIFWNSIWGTLVFILGESALKIIGLKYIIGIFLIWAAVILIRHYLLSRKNRLGATH